MTNMVIVLKHYGLWERLVTSLSARASETEIFGHLAYWQFKWFNRASSFGLCNYKKREISINRVLATPEMREQFEATMFHELAHMFEPIFFANYPRYMRRAHGQTWRKLMREMGYPNPTRCKTDKDANELLMEKRIERTKWMYTCKDCGTEIKTIRKLKSIERRFHGPCRFKVNGGRLSVVQVR